MKIRDLHTLERTNPKGESFIGRCIVCGKEGISMDDTEKCIDPNDISDTDLLDRVIQGEDDGSNSMEKD